MKGSLREPAQCVGTRDFDADPQIATSQLDRAAGVSRTASREESSAERCASLYDAIRDMTAYGSVMEAEG